MSATDSADKMDKAERARAARRIRVAAVQKQAEEAAANARLGSNNSSSSSSHATGQQTADQASTSQGTGAPATPSSHSHGPPQSTTAPTTQARKSIMVKYVHTVSIEAVLAPFAEKISDLIVIVANARSQSRPLPDLSGHGRAVSAAGAQLISVGQEAMVEGQSLKQY